MGRTMPPGERTLHNRCPLAHLHNSHLHVTHDIHLHARAQLPPACCLFQLKGGCAPPSHCLHCRARCTACWSMMILKHQWLNLCLAPLEDVLRTLWRLRPFGGGSSLSLSHIHTHTHSHAYTHVHTRTHLHSHMHVHLYMRSNASTHAIVDSQGLAHTLLFLWPRISCGKVLDVGNGGARDTTLATGGFFRGAGRTQLYGV